MKRWNLSAAAISLLALGTPFSPALAQNARSSIQGACLAEKLYGESDLHFLHADLMPQNNEAGLTGERFSVFSSVEGYSHVDRIDIAKPDQKGTQRVILTVSEELEDKKSLSGFVESTVGAYFDLERGKLALDQFTANDRTTDHIVSEAAKEIFKLANAATVCTVVPAVPGLTIDKMEVVSTPRFSFD